MDAGKIIQFFMVVSEITFRCLEALRYSGSKENFGINLRIMLGGTPSAVMLSSCPSRDSDHKCISGNVKCITCLALCSDYTAINLKHLYIITHQKHITMRLLRKWAIKLILSFYGVFDILQ